MNLGFFGYVAPPDESTRSLAEELLVNPTPQLLDLPEEAEHYQARTVSFDSRSKVKEKIQGYIVYLVPTIELLLSWNVMECDLI